MALKLCNECKAQISTDAKVCPHCGKRQGIGFLGGCLSVFGGLFILGLILSQFGTNTTPTNSTSPVPSPRTNSKVEVMSDVKLDFTWSKTGFDTIMKANFTVHNNSDYDIKDFEITCTHSASSGTIIDHNVRTIYDMVKAHSKRSFPNFDMGFIHSQAVRSGCKITDLTAVE